MPRKKPDEKPEGDLMTEIRQTERDMIVVVYNDEIAHEDGLFEHLGFDRQPTLEQFKARYAKGDHVDCDKLMSDVWNHKPTAARWRTTLDRLGFTVERHLHELLDMIDRWEKLTPQPPELQQLYEMRDQIMARNRILRH